MHTEQQEMGGSHDARDRHGHLKLERRRLTLIEPVFQPVPDRRARGRPQATDTGFGSRLRQERERRHVTLASIAADTKISLTLLQGLERDDVSRWPSGIFRRSFIRAYAQAVGLDADLVAREFHERFRDPAEPPRPMFADSASTPAARASGDTVLRLTLADAGAAFRRGRSPGGKRRRWVAAACDVSVLMALGLTFFMAFNQFWMPLAIATLGYYVASIVLLGNTPGVSLCAPGSSRDGATRPLASLVSPVKAVVSAIRSKPPTQPTSLPSAPGPQNAENATHSFQAELE
jgi:transcriptional regulator with XRE-family HTH domain